MTHRKLLLIHDSHTFQKIMARHLLSELSDIDLRQAYSADEALTLTQEENFRIIACGNEMNEMDGLALFEEIRKSETNRDTPFVIFTSSPTEANTRLFREHGIEHVIGVPCNPKELAHRIDEICNPRDWRKHNRVNVPDTRLVIRTVDMQVEAELINLSTGGVLCSMPWPKDVCSLFSSAELFLLFPEEFGGGELEAEAIFLRISVLDWDASDRPKTLRVAWRFRDLSDENRRCLEDVVVRAQEDLETITAKQM